MKHQIDRLTHISLDKWSCISAAILRSLRTRQAWFRGQRSSQVFLTLQGTFWLRSSLLVFPLCQANALQWSRSLFNVVNTGTGLFDIMRAGRPLPADVQHYLEFSPVFHLWFWKLVLSWSLEKAEEKAGEKTAHLTPPLRRLAKTHLLAYLRSKRKRLHSYLYSSNAEFSALWPQPFLPNLRIFSFSDEGSVKLLLVLPCGHLSAAAHNTCQTPGP